MKAVFDGSSVRCGKEGVVLYEQGGYGRRDKEGLRLAPHEALYLLHRGRIVVEGYDFDSLLSAFTDKANVLRSFLVYRDIRERGYAVQTGPHDFRVFRRGQRPGKGESLYLVRVVSERDPIRFRDLIKEVTTAHNLRKLYILAAVDDEDELTYYEIKLQLLPEIGEMPRYPHISGVPAGKSVMVKIPAGSAFEESWLGSRLDDSRTLFSPLETFYLTQEGILSVTDGPVTMADEDIIMRAGEGDSEFAHKAAVYTDLRRLGYIPKTGYKFGHHFRVYSTQKVHSGMLVHAVGQDSELPMSTISRSVRLAHSVKKKMLFGAVHSSGIQYIEFARIKL
ncbi:MAG: tRNA-splicing endonuclease [Methanoregula sp. PtaU1.Bin051]|nr:MAG: tRNA-splicing endonuclease [Methanoregula sp. PtaU1.Bin051]